MALKSWAVVDLRRRPEFAPVVAHRVWRAWWQPKGHGLAVVEDLVRLNLDSDPIPFALVAHEDGMFLGTASVIASDLATRQQFTPWVAAVWVDPVHRSNGVGAVLVRAAADQAQRLGADPVYLCALPPRHGFYRRLGWRMIEPDVTPAGLAIFQSPAGPGDARPLAGLGAAPHPTFLPHPTPPILRRKPPGEEPNP